MTHKATRVRRKGDSGEHNGCDHTCAAEIEKARIHGLKLVIGGM